MKVQASTGTQLAIAIGSLALMVALVCWSYVYPYPNGKVPELSFFVIFWFKEIILLTLVTLVFFATIAGWFIKFLRGKRTTDAEST